MREAGQGRIRPLVIEANTYRMQADTNADDGPRYRENSVVAERPAPLATP